MYYYDDEVLQDEILISSPSDADVVEYGEETDTTCYVSQPSAAPTSSGQQSAIWLLEIRNILLIFVLGYFCLIFYSKLKNLFINFFDM